LRFGFEAEGGAGETPVPPAAPQPPHGSAQSLLTPEGEVRFSAVRDWFRAQPRFMRMAIGTVGLLLFINLMTGIGSPWFLWPSVPIMGFALIRLAGRDAADEGGASEERAERRHLRRAGRRRRQ
jgi:hypothetical protein